MSNHAVQQTAQEPARINLDDERELKYWAAKFGVSREQLTDAVEAAGANPGLVEAELRKAERRGG
jgi:hypothetical protein